MPSVALISIIIFPPWDIVWAWITPIPDSIQVEVDSAIGHGFDGIIVYVDQGGNPPAFYSAGWSDRDLKRPANPHDLFKIASISKLYVAVAIAKLVNKDSLDLDDPLSILLPDIAEHIQYSDEITLKMMVQHRSGIPNFSDHPDFWVNPPENNQEALALIFDLPANFEPDANYAYSNTNYMLISEIVDTVLGYSHHRFIKEEFLIPQGLSNTFSSLHEVDMDDVMSGYYVGVEHDIKTVNYGSMIATAEDVGLFLRALNDGTLFEGREKQIYSSIYEYEHTGLIPGYQSIARYHEDIDAVIIQFINTTNFVGNTWTLSEIVYNRLVKILRKGKR